MDWDLNASGYQDEAHATFSLVLSLVLLVMWNLRVLILIGLRVEGIEIARCSCVGFQLVLAVGRYAHLRYVQHRGELLQLLLLGQLMLVLLHVAALP
jgi:hypothetical protein